MLFENVARFLHERPLRAFRPQRFCLNLMNAADNTALFCYGPLVWKSRLARHVKKRIDRAWIDKFSPAPMSVSATEEEVPLDALRWLRVEDFRRRACRRC